MSLNHRSSYYGGRHARKKTRKNIVMGPKNFKDKHEDTIYAQRQQVRVYMMMQQPQHQTRRYSKKPPPKPKRLYLEKEWSSSPSPPDSPSIVDGFELVPPIAPKERPPRPPPPKIKTLPIEIPNNGSNSNNNRSRVSPVRGKENLMSERAAPPNMKPPPLPKPRLQNNVKDSTNDVSVAELKSKLRAVQSVEACSVGSAMLKLTPPKSVTKKSPPPSAQRAAQAKLQPLLPPTAKPRKTKTETSASQSDALVNGSDRDPGRVVAQPIAGKRKDVVKSVDDTLLHKPAKPLPKLPMPVPRVRMKSEDDGVGMPQSSKPPTPSHPLPVPKSRNGNGSKDHATVASSTKHEDEELTKTPFRPVPRARVISKESKEQVLGNKMVKTVGGNSNIELSKPPVPRKRVYKESGTETPAKEGSSPFSQPAVPRHRSPKPAASLASRGSVRLSGSSPYGDRTGRSKRKKGGGIRGPLWRAPPPPDFTPPPTPGHTPKRSPKPQVPSIARLSDTPPSSRRSFDLPPFQHSPMLASQEETTPSFFMMPTTPDDPAAKENPIELAKTPVAHPRVSTEIHFEENLFENKSIKKKRRVPSGQNVIPINIVQELQSNFRMQARR